MQADVTLMRGIDEIRTDATGAIVSMSRYTITQATVEMEVEDPQTGERKRMLVPGQKRVHRAGAWSREDSQHRVDPEDDESDVDEAKVEASRKAYIVGHLKLDNDTAERAAREAALRDMLDEHNGRIAALKQQRDQLLARVAELESGGGSGD